MWAGGGTTFSIAGSCRTATGCSRHDLAPRWSTEHILLDFHPRCPRNIPHDIRTTGKRGIVALRRIFGRLGQAEACQAAGKKVPIAPSLTGTVSLDAHQNKRGKRNMWRTKFGMARAIALMFVSALCSYPQTLKIWPGIAPGSETWTQKERVEKNTPIGSVVFNVVTPTLTVYLPERTKATGTGIIIAPGGAFVALAIDLEGHDVARWLQAKGIAAFVLKYRIMEKRHEGIPDLNMDEAGKYGIADGIQAVK